MNRSSLKWFRQYSLDYILPVSGAISTFNSDDRRSISWHASSPTDNNKRRWWFITNSHLWTAVMTVLVLDSSIITVPAAAHWRAAVIQRQLPIAIAIARLVYLVGNIKVFQLTYCRPETNIYKLHQYGYILVIELFESPWFLTICRFMHIMDSRVSTSR